jgi:hypothetical protein
MPALTSLPASESDFFIDASVEALLDARTCRLIAGFDVLPSFLELVGKVVKHPSDKDERAFVHALPSFYEKPINRLRVFGVFLRYQDG